jgi:hypothetical protein
MKPMLKVTRKKQGEHDPEKRMPQARDVRRWQPILAEHGARGERDIDPASRISTAIPTRAVVSKF